MSVAGCPSVHAMDLWMATDFEAFDTLVSFGTAVDEHGLASPSLRTIAGHANCSAATLVNWFGSKRELHRRTLVALGVKWGHVLFGDLLPTDPQGASTPGFGLPTKRSPARIHRSRSCSTS